MLNIPCLTIALPISPQYLKDNSKHSIFASKLLLNKTIASQALLANSVSDSSDFGKYLRVSCKQAFKFGKLENYFRNKFKVNLL